MRQNCLGDGDNDRFVPAALFPGEQDCFLRQPHSPRPRTKCAIGHRGAGSRPSDKHDEARRDRPSRLCRTGIPQRAWSDRKGTVGQEATAQAGRGGGEGRAQPAGEGAVAGPRSLQGQIFAIARHKTTPARYPAWRGYQGERTALEGDCRFSRGNARLGHKVPARRAYGAITCFLCEVGTTWCRCRQAHPKGEAAGFSPSSNLGRSSRVNPRHRWGRLCWSARDHAPCFAYR
jgi:hypothetical protein